MIQNYRYCTVVHTIHVFTLFSISEGLIWLIFFPQKDLLIYTKILLGLHCTNLKFLYLDFRGGQLTRYHHSYSSISISVNLNPFGLQKALRTSQQTPKQKRDSFRHNYSCVPVVGMKTPWSKKRPWIKRWLKYFLLYFHFVFKRMKGGWKTPWPKARKDERKHGPGKIADLGADCLTTTATENRRRLKWTLKTSLFRNPNI